MFKQICIEFRSDHCAYNLRVKPLQDRVAERTVRRMRRSLCYIYGCRCLENPLLLGRARWGKDLYSVVLHPDGLLEWGLKSNG